MALRDTLTAPPPRFRISLPRQVAPAVSPMSYLCQRIVKNGANIFEWSNMKNALLIGRALVAMIRRSDVGNPGYYSTAQDMNCFL